MNNTFRLLLFILIVTGTILNCNKTKGKEVNYTASNLKVLQKRALDLPGIEIDSLTLNNDSLIVFITDNYNKHLNEVSIDQYVTLLFQDYSLASETDFSQIKVNYQIPKRDSTSIGYFEIMDIQVSKLKEHLVMFTNGSYKEIIDTLSVLHKENPEMNILEKLNFYSNQILYEEKKTEFQMFGVNFMKLITPFLIECEKESGDYYQKVIRKIILELESTDKMPDELILRLNNVLSENCSYLKSLR